MNKIKVLTIVSRLNVGGIEKTLLSGIPFFRKSNIEMSILCEKGGDLDKQFEFQGVKIIDFAGLKMPFIDTFRLYQVLKNGNFDIVHSRLGHTSGLFAWLCKKMGIPFLISIHNEKAMFKNSWENHSLLSLLRAKYLDLHKKLSFNYATKIIGHSRTNLNYFDFKKNQHSDKFNIVYNGVSFDSLCNFQQLPKIKKEKLLSFRKNSKILFCHIGSFKDQKNHQFLVDVFERLKPKTSRYGLILIGTGNNEKKIKNQVNELGLSEHVFFTGVEQNIGPYLEQSDVFFFPSLYEGFGNVLIEAQFMRNIICASDIQPHYESVSEIYHPYFFSPLDIEQAVLCTNMCLEEMLTSENKDEAANFASSFTIEQMVQNLSEIYRQVI